SRAVQLKTQRTLVLVKPDGVQRHLVGEIIRRFEQAGMKLVGLKLVWATPRIIDRHYRHDAEYLTSIGEKTIKGMKELGITMSETPLEIGQRVRSYLTRFLAISPVVAMVLQGTNAIRNTRQLVGSTDPLMADIGSIRGDLTIDTIQLADLEQRTVRNLIHASGDPEEAEREIPIWFSPDELHAYRTVMDVVLHDENWDRPARGRKRARR
ncbi:MAG: nucleoside-diphosphate kinase, partial [bacterium]|nr:nucleoside-diphosphate kinase [bacterium]